MADNRHAWIVRSENLGHGLLDSGAVRGIIRPAEGLEQLGNAEVQVILRIGPDSFGDWRSAGHLPSGLNLADLHFSISWFAVRIVRASSSFAFTPFSSLISSSRLTVCPSK